VRIYLNRGRFPSAVLVALLAAVLALGLAACGSSNKSSSSSTGSAAAPTTAAATPAATDTTAAATPAAGGESKCGLGNGQKATGTPIKIGGIDTLVPGTDFTDIGNGAKAYFDCVNDNGGINGHPVEYTLETEAIDPGQAAAAAKKLIQSVKVVGLVGNSSIIECTVNHKFYEQQGYYVIAAGIAPECYATPNIASINMGARYSSDGAAQYVLSQGVKKLVFDQSNVPGTGYNAGGVELIAKKAGVPEVSLKDNVPIQDANSVALKLVQAAGNGGGVVLNYTPPEALKIFTAAQKLGLEKRVKWACSTPCNTDFLAKALGPKWNGQLGVNAELALTSATGPDSVLYRKVLSQYAPKISPGSFSQMGFVAGRIATDAMMKIKGAYTAKSVNAAFKAVKDFKTDILCKPWYFGDAPLHIPNNTDRTVTPKDGVMAEAQGCFAISDTDPDIGKVRKIEAGQ
jgi:branched-chain amino acid transport system substrate-binding protein